MVSESAVSAAIKACEQEIGYSIFIRRPAKPLVLTRTGAEFVRSAQHFVDHAEAFYEQSVGFGTHLKGTIRLGCFSAFSSLLTQLAFSDPASAIGHLDRLTDPAAHDSAALTMLRIVLRGNSDVSVAETLFRRLKTQDARRQGAAALHEHLSKSDPARAARYR